MKVVRMQGTRTGGTVYAEMVVQSLRQAFSVSDFVIENRAPHWLRSLGLIPKFFRLRRSVMNDPDCKVVVSSFDAALFPAARGPKNIIMVFHLDFSSNRYQTLYSLLKPHILKTLRRADAIVVISEFWNQYLRERGCTRLWTIYNGFDVDQFTFELQELEEFKNRNNLGRIPIVYLGNYASGKGVEEAFQTLQGLDVAFVTSGVNIFPDRRVLSFSLGYRDYLRLLKVSSVVITMSQFDEGWCRTAHEALLCRTPVIGSGRGGMRELLLGGGQKICERVSDLRGAVENLLDHPEWKNPLGAEGYAYASQFTIQKFQRDWINFLSEVHQEPLSNGRKRTPC